MSNNVMISLGDDEVIVKQKRHRVAPNYIRIGNGSMNKHKIKSINLIEEMFKSAKAGQWLINMIQQGINYENEYSPVVLIRKNELTPLQQKYLKEGYKELVCRDLVRRIKNGYYMINPNALIPPDYEKALAIWEEAEARNTKKVNKDKQE